MKIRKITYKLYPNKAEQNALLECLRLQKDLYNGALQERIDCYQKTGKSLSYNQQQASLTQIRADIPEYKALPVYLSRMTLKRLDITFKSFFNRVKKGQTPGFPRFKSIKRFTSFEICAGSGWSFNFGNDRKNGTLHINNIGTIKARGQARTLGKPKTSQVMYKGGKWFLSLTVECEPEREMTSAEAMGMDWGVSHLMTITHEDGSYIQIKNPRYYQHAKEQLLMLAQAVSRKKRGSNRWRKASKALAQLRAKIARKRHHDHHQLSHDIAQQYAFVATETLTIKNMTGSAKGTAEAPGKNVAQKAGLNREILDTSPAKLLAMICYKVEETGSEYKEVSAKKVKPSQRCPDCLTVIKKSLSMRTHKCACGCHMPRDAASGLVMLRSALGTLFNRSEILPGG
jgi:putative transposase